MDFRYQSAYVMVIFGISFKGILSITAPYLPGYFREIRGGPEMPLKNKMLESTRNLLINKKIFKLTNHFSNCIINRQS